MTDSNEQDRPTGDAAAAPEDQPVSREHVRRVLRARAEALAKKLDSDNVEESSEFVVLDLEESCFAIDADIVREVLAVRDVTPLPSAPAFVMGLTNVRGKIVAVLDLRAVLGRTPASKSSGQVIVVEVGGVEVAVDVDECAVTRIAPSRLLPAGEQGGPYLSAVSADNIGVLDIEKIIAETRQSAASLASEGAS